MAFVLDTVTAYFFPTAATETVPAASASSWVMNYMFPPVPVEKKIPRPENDIYKTLAKKNSGIAEIGDDIGDDFLYDDLPDPNDDLEEYLDIDVEETKTECVISVPRAEYDRVVAKNATLERELAAFEARRKVL